MAGLFQLKLSMMMSIILLSVIFSAFLITIMFLLQLPIWLAFLSTFIFLLLQYLVGPIIVRGSTRLQYLRSGENPWLEGLVSNLAKKGHISAPRLAIVPDETPNAFVFGRTARGATLAVHQGLLRQLNQEEVAAVIGHELGHLKHKDYAVMTMLSALPLLAYWISWSTFQAGRWSRNGSRSRNNDRKGLKVAFFVVAIISYIVYIIALLFTMGLSRLREHYADAYSAYLTFQPRQLQSALTKITYGLSLTPKPTTGFRNFYIGDPAMAKREYKGILSRKDAYDLDRDGVLDGRELELAMEREAKSTWTTINELFSTHPPTYKRILLLREIEDEMNSGDYSSDRIYSNI